MSKPILDLTDGQLDALLTEGMIMQVDNPVMSELRDLVCELALRVREIRRAAKLGATEHNGIMWVRADQILSLLDGG